MSISNKIEEQKNVLIQKYIEQYKTTGVGLSKALKLMYLEIQKMRDDKLSLSEQINILNGIFDIKIKYDTYKKWSARHFKKSTKTVKKTTPNAHKKTVKKVAPSEPKKGRVTLDNFDKVSAKVSSEYDDLF